MNILCCANDEQTAKTCTWSKWMNDFDEKLFLPVGAIVCVAHGMNGNFGWLEKPK